MVDAEQPQRAQVPGNDACKNEPRSSLNRGRLRHGHRHTAMGEQCHRCRTERSECGNRVVYHLGKLVNVCLLVEERYLSADGAKIERIRSPG